ncbi:MAG: trimethylamine methyltransferase family protein, partial [Candidatus Neomarinimicrobiota bacterium]
MRPKLKFLSGELIKKIYAESISILESIGVEINNPGLVSFLEEHGARVNNDKQRIYFSETLVNKALKSVPDSFSLFNSGG